MRIGKIGVIIATFLLLLLFGQLCLGEETKTAYTKDGVNFISKARMDENIKYKYAEPGDYWEEQVPLSTRVTGASEFVEDTSRPAETRSAQRFPTAQPSPIPKTSATEKVLLIGIISVCCVVIYWGVSRIIKQYR